MKKLKLPKMVKCAGCGKNLVVEKYLSGFPLAGVPDKRIGEQGANQTTSVVTSAL